MNTQDKNSLMVQTFFILPAHDFREQCNHLTEIAQDEVISTNYPCVLPQLKKNKLTDIISH